MLAVILHIIVSYFEWWSTFFYSIFALVVWHYNRSLFYDEALDETAMYLIFASVWFVAMIFIVHLIITSVGMLFAESEVLRNGNENILDNLEEGVVILNQQDMGEILYFNAAASDGKRREDSADKSEFDLQDPSQKPNVAAMV